MSVVCPVAKSIYSIGGRAWPGAAAPVIGQKNISLCQLLLLYTYMIYRTTYSSRHGEGCLCRGRHVQETRSKKMKTENTCTPAKTAARHRQHINTARTAYLPPEHLARLTFLPYFRPSAPKSCFSFPSYLVSAASMPPSLSGAQSA